MERTSLNKNITIKKIFEGGYPLYMLSENFVQGCRIRHPCPVLNIICQYEKLHEVDKLFTTKFYQFEMKVKDPFISVYTMTQGRGGETFSDVWVSSVIN